MEKFQISLAAARVNAGLNSERCCKSLKSGKTDDCQLGKRKFRA